MKAQVSVLSADNQVDCTYRSQVMQDRDDIISFNRLLSYLFVVSIGGVPKSNSMHNYKKLRSFKVRLRDSGSSGSFEEIRKRSPIPVNDLSRSCRTRAPRFVQKMLTLSTVLVVQIVSAGRMRKNEIYNRCQETRFATYSVT